MLCRDSTIRLATDYGEVAAPIKCRAWTCEMCAPERQAQMQSTCINGKPNRFITITCRRGQFATPEEAAAAIAKAWGTAVLKWRRLNKWHKCEYFCVFEATKAGWPHLHVLWRGHWLDYQWLSKLMSKLLNSPRVHVSAINTRKQAAFYVSKYFSKAPVRFGTCKRYWSSRNFGKPYNTDAPRAFPDGMKPSMVPRPITEIVKEWIRDRKDIWHIKERLFGWGQIVDTITGEVHGPPPDAEPYEWQNA